MSRSHGKILLPGDFNFYKQFLENGKAPCFIEMTVANKIQGVITEDR